MDKLFQVGHFFFSHFELLKIFDSWIQIIGELLLYLLTKNVDLVEFISDAC